MPGQGLRMGRYFDKILDGTVDGTVRKVTRALAAKGFIVLSTLDVRAMMKGRLNAELRPYVVLGVCNPHFAWRALQAEGRAGTLLPCNVIVREVERGSVEVAVLDPKASMAGSPNSTLARVAIEVGRLLDEMVGGL